jgi:beta-galactosidase
MNLKISKPSSILKVAMLSVCFLAVFFYSCINTSSVDIVKKGRTVSDFGTAWQFQRLEDSTENKDWETINLPHTVKIEPLVVNDQWQGTSRYKKEFQVDKIATKKWFFNFEGVMQKSWVIINDSLAKIHKGGYLPFMVDATSFLKENATNKIEVIVINEDNPKIPPGKPLKNLDFNLYGGIYRNVQLIITNEIYITNAVAAKKVNSGGILVHFDSISNHLAEGEIKTHIKNESQHRQHIKLKIIFWNKKDKKIVVSSEEKTVQAGDDISFSEALRIENPRLWSIDSPNLYNLRVEVFANGRLLDSKQIKAGIRKIELKGNGFYLNDKELFINGTNRHQEYPYIGYALSDEAQFRDAYKIKEAGFDFVRLSHYPQATAFLEACDELGLLVMNAIPGWQFYQEGDFVKNALQDIKDMARRDRNHPSVIFWENSLNESGMSEDFIKQANAALKAELPYKDTFTAGWIDHPSYDLYIPARQHAKPPHYWNNYDKPNRPIFIAEYGDWEYYAQNAGFNQTAFSDLKEENRSSRQLRSSGEKGLIQQALNFQEAFNSNLKGEQTIGHANWLMFDYNRGYSDDLEASGISDIFRIPKFSYYFYKSQKAASKDYDPMVFIANYWKENSSKTIKVFSNTEEIALYLNDKLIAKKKPEINEISDELPFPPFTFELARFEPGELKAVGIINGKEVTRHIVNTPQDPAKIELEVDLSGKEIAKKTSDVVFIYAKITDKNGTLVPDAQNEIQFEVEGSAEIIGGNMIKAKAGIATIVLSVYDLENRELIIRAKSANLEGDTLKINE